MVKFLNEIKKPKVVELGGKGYSLAMLINNGFNVSKGFVITSGSFLQYFKKNHLLEKIKALSTEINENNFQSKSKTIKQLILDGKMPAAIITEVKFGLNKLNAKYVAVRSSGIAEDSLKASFAGLFDTYLNIKTESDLVLENIKKCWASLFNERAIIYRIRKNLSHFGGMAVIIQEMVDAESSGVVFTVNPITKKRNELVLEAGFGLGDLIVSGKEIPDSYIVDKRKLKIVRKQIGEQNKASRIIGGRIKMMKLTKTKKLSQKVPDEKILELTKLCIKIEKYCKFPQDIEWCYIKGKIYILQTRPITA